MKPNDKRSESCMVTCLVCGRETNEVTSVVYKKSGKQQHGFVCAGKCMSGTLCTNMFLEIAKEEGFKKI